MPISRVMNNPDGSTPTPPIGGGDVNGTLAPSIVSPGSGTGADQLSQARHLHFLSSALGIPNVAPGGDVGC